MSGEIRRKNGSQSIGSVIHGVLKRAQQQHGALFDIQQGWPSIVGKGLAAHTKPVSVRNGRLTVHVDRPGDNFTLSYQRTQVLERVREFTQCTVTELVIRAGKV